MKTLQICRIAVAAMSVVVGSSVHVQAQNVLLIKRDSSRIETKIKAHTTGTLITYDGNILMKDVATAHFKQKTSIDEKLYSYLLIAGVRLQYDYNPTKKVADPVYVGPVNTPAESVQVVTLDDSLEKFRKARETAKIFELLGAVALSASMIMNTVASDQTQSDFKSGAYTKVGYKAPTYAPAALPIAGGLFLSIGFGIDIGAGNHLKRK